MPPIVGGICYFIGQDVKATFIASTSDLSCCCKVRLRANNATHCGETDCHASVLCAALRAACGGCALHAPAGAVARNDAETYQ